MQYHLLGSAGLTGIGDPDSLRTVMRSRRFATIQTPFHLLNPSALVETPHGFREPDYGGCLRDANHLGMGLFAIRVYAAGALLGAPPSTCPPNEAVLRGRDARHCLPNAERCFRKLKSIAAFVETVAPNIECAFDKHSQSLARKTRFLATGAGGR